MKDLKPTKQTKTMKKLIQSQKPGNLSDAENEEVI